MRTLLAAAAFATIAGPACAADRPVTEPERTRLVAALSEAGCSGGKMEWDQSDMEFEVDDAICGGRKFDLKLNADYSLKSRKEES